MIVKQALLFNISMSFGHAYRTGESSMSYYTTAQILIQTVLLHAIAEGRSSFLSDQSQISTAKDYRPPQSYTFRLYSSLHYDIDYQCPTYSYSLPIGKVSVSQIVKSQSVWHIFNPYWVSRPIISLSLPYAPLHSLVVFCISRPR